jgi:hypothetical protein
MDKPSENLDQRLEALTIVLPRYSRSVLIARACKQHNQRQQAKARKLDDLYAEVQTISPQAHANVLARLAVNYLQALCEQRYPEFAALRGQSKQFAFYAGFRSKVLTAIATSFDWLAEECERQQMI